MIVAKPTGVVQSDPPAVVNDHGVSLFIYLESYRVAPIDNRTIAEG
jgi:hypothetical protein